MEQCPRCGQANPASESGFDPGPATPLSERLFDIGFAAIARRGTALVSLVVLATIALRGSGLEGYVQGHVIFGALVALVGAVALWRRRGRSPRP